MKAEGTAEKRLRCATFGALKGDQNMSEVWEQDGWMSPKKRD